MVKIYQDKKKDKLTIGIHFGNLVIGIYYNKLIRTLFIYPIPFLVIRIRL